MCRQAKVIEESYHSTMQLEYRFLRSEINGLNKELIKASAKPVPVVRRILICLEAGIMMGCCVLIATSSDFSGRTIPLVMVIAQILSGSFFVSALLIRPMIWRLAIKRVLADPLLEDLQKLEISPGHFMRTSRRVVSISRWSTVSSLLTSKNYFYLLLTNYSVLVVPRSAFANSTEATNFEELVRSYYDTAHPKAIPSPEFTRKTGVWPPPPSTDGLGIEFSATTKESFDIPGPELDKSKEIVIMPKLKASEIATFNGIYGFKNYLLPTIMLIFYFMSFFTMASTIMEFPSTLAYLKAILGEFVALLLWFGFGRIVWIAKHSMRTAKLQSAARIITDFRRLVVVDESSCSNWDCEFLDSVHWSTVGLFVWISDSIARGIPKSAFPNRDAAFDYYKRLKASVGRGN